MKVGNTNPGIRTWVTAAAMMLLGACASQSPELDAQPLATSPWATASFTADSSAPWRHQVFPGKLPSFYRYVRIDGRDAVMVDSSSSVSMVRQVERVEPAQLNRLRFSWKVPALIENADLSVRELADSPVRVMLGFEGDRSKLSAKNAMLSDLAQLLTGEPMPYATLMYVWCNQDPLERVLVDKGTDRIRKIVMESGTGNLHRWMDYERDIRADFVKAFGEPPGALVVIGIMTDTDNTRSTARAWYGPVRHVPIAMKL
jgi:hypothetical protein